MKRADVPDGLVIELVRQRVDVIEGLMTRGIPRKVALAKVEHMCDRGLLDYGVCPNQAWVNEDMVN